MHYSKVRLPYLFQALLSTKSPIVMRFHRSRTAMSQTLMTRESTPFGRPMGYTAFIRFGFQG